MPYVAWNILHAISLNRQPQQAEMEILSEEAEADAVKDAAKVEEWLKADMARAGTVMAGAVMAGTIVEARMVIMDSDVLNLEDGRAFMMS